MLGLLSSALLTQAAEPVLTIEAGEPVGAVSPLFFGLMTEEINYSYDGGLYAELIRNRAFLDHREKPVHWTLVLKSGSTAKMELDRQHPLNEAIPVSLRLDAADASPAQPVGIANEGYFGIPAMPSTRYRASFHARAAAGFSGPVTISLVSEDHATVYAQTRVGHLSGEWKSYEVSLKTGGKVIPTTKARLVLSVEHPGTVWFSFVSLFPPTWKGQPNGFRPDLMQMLVDMNPKFLRFPGGNYLEGDTVETRFKWKETLGPIEKRPGHPCPWGYRSTDGMGLMEFLTWCEDMKAEPLLAVYAGYSLKGAHVNPGPDLEPFVQEALDEIEYVTGPVDSKWGALRARDGHPRPFPLHYVEIGNEDWFDKSGSYEGRFAQFFDAIKAKYPNLKCISTVGNEQPEKLRIHSRKPDSIDEHYYRPAPEFIKDGAHYDHYERKGPEIFVGEWAAHETSFPPWDKRSEKEAPTPSMKAALGDAVWMTAMERNADIVRMHCYAPLLVNIKGRQWRPNLIGYDALHTYGSPSYYAQKMFSGNLGDQLLKVGFSGTTNLFCSATKDGRTGVIYVKLVNPTASEQPLEINLKGASLATTARAEILAAAPEATNSIQDPTKVVPTEIRLNGLKPTFKYTVPASSLVVLKLKSK